MVTLPDGWLPASPRVRVVVDRAEPGGCQQVGDSFDVDGSGLATDGKPFCPYALAAVIPVLGLRQSPMPADDWLVRKPYICCPEPSHGVVMRLDRVDA